MTKLIGFGISQQKFFDNHYEKRLYVQKRAFDHKVNWDEINAVLHGLNPTSENIRLFNNGPVPVENYTEDYIDIHLPRKRIIKDVFYEHMKKGATLVLNRLDISSILAKQFCREISQFVGEQSVANGYVAFGDKESFGNHWDTHDVFAVQLIGRKRWKIYEPTFPLPLLSQTSRNHKYECPSEPVFDEILEAGDILYIPRGWWHTAVPLNEETFHLAVGVYPALVIDYMYWICQHALSNHVEYRKSLRTINDGLEPMLEAIDTLKNEILNIENFQSFQNAFIEQKRVVSNFDIKTFGSPDREKINPESTLRINSYSKTTLDQKNIVLNGFKINLDGSAAKIMKIISESDYLSVKDLTTQLPDICKRKLESLLYDLAFREVIDISE